MRMATWWMRTLREKRDMEAAQRFDLCRRSLCRPCAGMGNERMTISPLHEQFMRILGDHVQHRTSKYLNKCLEQDHRGIKQCSYPMHGFGNIDSIAHFVVLLMNDETTFILTTPWEKTSLTHRTATGFP